ncbi:MAG: hypothetical protein QNK24_08945, partial [Desulfuromusa sp.]|nr:hypothetical protein [Desulfuromusa sp.]
GPFPGWDSADAAVVTIKAIPDTEIKLIAMNEWVPRSANGSSDDIAVHLSDPLFSLYLKNNSVENLTLVGQYMTTDEDFDDQNLTNVPPPFANTNGDFPSPTGEAYDTYYLEAIYAFATKTPFTVMAQYAGVDYDERDDSGFYGVQVKTKLAGFGLSAAYTKVDDDEDFPGVYGHRPSYAYTQSLALEPVFAGLQALKLAGDYGFQNGLKTSLALMLYKNDENSAMDDIAEIDLGLKYKFSGALDGFSVGIITAYVMYDETLPGGDDDDMFYTRANLDFRF